MSTTRSKNLGGGLGPNGQTLAIPAPLNPATDLAKRQEHATPDKEWISGNQAAALALGTMVVLVLTLGFTILGFMALYATQPWQVVAGIVCLAVLASFPGYGYTYGYTLVRDSILSLNRVQVSAPFGYAVVMPVLLGTACWLLLALSELCLIVYESCLGIMVATQKVIAFILSRAGNGDQAD